MKHKYFNEVYPYGYFLMRKSDGMKYVGIRYKNVKLNLTPLQDFGKVYFTSGKLKKDFKRNPNDYFYTIMHTFDSVEEAFEWEKEIVLQHYSKPDWANQGWGRNFGENPEIGKLISEGKRKIKSSGKTSVEQGAEILKEWIWTTEEGEYWRNQNSNRKSLFWETISEERKLEIVEKRKANMDFFSSAKKAAETRNKVGDDGLTCFERGARKGIKTRKESGSLSKQGKQRDSKFTQMLGEMSEEEFKKYCEGKSPRIVKGWETRRQKWLKQD